MLILFSAAVLLGTLIVMFAFGLYGRRNLKWVALCVAWGASGFVLSNLVNQKAADLSLDRAILFLLLLPAFQQLLVALGVFSIIHWEKFDNLVDGAVYGFTTGLGYSLGQNLAHPNDGDLQQAFLRIFSMTLVAATASGVVGVAMSQFYFLKKSRRAWVLLGGLAVGIMYTAAYNLLVTLKIGGDILPIAFGIGGITLVGLYVAGQLREILVQWGKEKKRANGLLEIVIPIGVELTEEKDFPRLLERLLVEAKSFCHADAGILYLKRDNLLEASVVRNDTLQLIMGGTSGTVIEWPSIPLRDEGSGKPNVHNITARAALTGQTINVPDAYEDEEYNFAQDRAFDESREYASVSYLVIPLRNSAGETLGVLQLLNAMDEKKKRLTRFDENLQQLMESFSSLASAALEGYLQEQKLKNEIKQLRIEIDMVKRAQQVEEITDTEYFKDLKQKTQELRNRSASPKQDEMQ